MNNLSNLYSSASSMQPQQTHSHPTQAGPTSLPPPPLQKGSTTGASNSAAVNNPNTSSDNDSISTSPTSILSQAAAASTVSAAASVTSSCFTSAATSGFGPGLTSRDFRDFGLGVGRHHSAASSVAAQTALDRYPYLSQTS